MTEDELLAKLTEEMRAEFPLHPVPEIQFACRAVFEENPEAGCEGLRELARERLLGPS